MVACWARRRAPWSTATCAVAAAGCGVDGWRRAVRHHHARRPATLAPSAGRAMQRLWAACVCQCRLKRLSLRSA